MDQPTSIDSSPSSTPQNTPVESTPPHNPYQRMASRRAIACVTCAKAKTKCDKGLPSCARCVSKGIKCDPRSTRRTSESNYRSNIKKPFATPKRYQSMCNLSSLSPTSSPQSASPSKRHRAMRTPSHIDLRAAIKMGQLQTSACSGMPPLTPLPSYTPQITESCYSYSSSCDQNISSFTPTLETSSFPLTGPLTPQTPEPVVYHEPLSMGSFSDQWMVAQPWSDDSLVSVGLGFDDLTAMLPTELWSPFGHAHTAPIAQMPWNQSSLSVSPQPLLSELVPDATAVPSLSTSECSVEDFGSSGTFHDDWTDYQPIMVPLDMANMMSCTPFVNNILPTSSTGPMWEDVFIPRTSSY